MSESTPTTTTTATAPPAAAPASSEAPPAAAAAATTTTSSSDSVKAAPAPATTQKKETAQPSTVESVVASVKRYIPGLNREPSETTATSTGASKKRNRPKKAAATATDKDIKGASDPALATATLETAPDKSELPDSLTVGSGGAGGAGGAAGAKARPAALNGGANDLSQDELAALEQKRFSPAALVQKRLKVNNKKLQRISGYEAQSEALNADQKKAVAGKPALESVQKELSELTKVFEAEEADDEKRLTKRKDAEEKQVQQRIQAAVSAANLHTQNDLTLLLQFLHLYSCFNPSQSGFAPPTLPPVVANATAQQHSAVHSLFHSLANGPLFGGAAAAASGGPDDAVGQIKALQDGSSSEVVEGVSYADIKQMILDLTAPPAEVGHEIPETEAPASAQGGNANDSGAPNLSFLQASEIGTGTGAGAGAGVGVAGDQLAPPTPADDAQHEKALESHALPVTPGFGSAIPTSASGVQTPLVTEPQVAQSSNPAAGWGESTNTDGLTQDKLPAAGLGNGWGDDAAAPGEIKSWADEVDDSQPSNPFTATADVPTELSGAAATASPATGTDGFQSVGGGERGDGRGRGRGRGGRGGRGEFRGNERGSYRGGRGRSDGQSQWRNSGNRDPALAAIAAGEAAGEVIPGAPGTVEAERRGGYRGGRGGDRPRGEYRGGGRGRGAGGEGGESRPRSEYRGGRGRGEGRGSFRGHGQGQSAAPAQTPAPVAPAA